MIKQDNMKTLCQNLDSWENLVWCSFGFLSPPKSKCVPTSLLLAGTTWNVRVNGRGNIGTLVQIIPPPFCYAPSFLTRNELNICEVLRVLICPFLNMIAKFCQQKVHCIWVYNWNCSQIESKMSSLKVSFHIPNQSRFECRPIRKQ